MPEKIRPVGHREIRQTEGLPPLFRVVCDVLGCGWVSLETQSAKECDLRMAAHSENTHQTEVLWGLPTAD